MFDIFQVLLLIVPLLFHLGGSKQLNRFLTVCLTTIIITQHEENFLLSNDILVKLGNWSYSIYLFHWPLLTLHRYVYVDLYQNEAEAEIIGLINASKDLQLQI